MVWKGKIAYSKWYNRYPWAVLEPLGMFLDHFQAKNRLVFTFKSRQIFQIHSESEYFVFGYSEASKSFRKWLFRPFFTSWFIPEQFPINRIQFWTVFKSFLTIFQVKFPNLVSETFLPISTIKRNVSLQALAISDFRSDSIRLDPIQSIGPIQSVQSDSNPIFHVCFSNPIHSIQSVAVRFNAFGPIQCIRSDSIRFGPIEFYKTLKGVRKPKTFG